MQFYKFRENAVTTLIYASYLNSQSGFHLYYGLQMLLPKISIYFNEQICGFIRFGEENRSYSMHPGHKEFF